MCFVSDVNECQRDTTNQCSQRCINVPKNASPGSSRGVSCGCDAGYILEQDGDTCRGATFLLIPFGAMVTPKHNGHTQTQWSHPNTMVTPKHNGHTQTQWSHPNTMVTPKHNGHTQTQWSHPNTMVTPKHKAGSNLR